MPPVYAWPLPKRASFGFHYKVSRILEFLRPFAGLDEGGVPGGHEARSAFGKVVA